jgi:isochorismate synthase
VNLAVEAMKNGKFNKVVLSKIRIENLNPDFSTPEFFLKLCDKYPHAFVYLMQIPQVGCWMGATPEPLLVIEDEKVNTVSLAGTQISTGEKIESYKWSSKEIEEQGIVTNFVEQTLKSLDIKHCSKIGPTNYQAANLIHLKTAFEFPQAELKNRFNDLLKALHPSPSVGGLPKAEAREFILANEKHDRSYYTGFMGPVNIENKTNIFVNLRCLQLFEKQFVLYSGAGITASSIPENEWEETENKMQTMMNVMVT